MMPPFVSLPFFFALPSLSWPFALPHDACSSSVLDLPGGGPNLVGHGGWPLACFGGLATTSVGRGVGFAVGFGVGFGVGLGVGRAVGRGVGSGVGRAVGRAVGRGVGRGVGRAVGAGVGRAVGPGVFGLSVGPGVFGCWVGRTAVGVPVATGPSVGAGVRAGVSGVAVGATDGVGVGMTAVLDGVGVGTPVGCPVTVGSCVGTTSVAVGTGVGTTAIGGRDDAAERCWSSMPPTPSAIVASTRLTMPRLRISRARWDDVTSVRDSLLMPLGPVDGTRGPRNRPLTQAREARQGRIAPGLRP